MSPYEVVFNQKPRKPTKIKLGSTTDEMGNCNPTEKMHVTHSQHTLIWKNNLAIQNLQNYKKEHLPNGSLIKKNIITTHINP